MAPRPKVDFVYMYFHYEPQKLTKNLEVKYEHNNVKISDFLVTQRQWALHILSKEVTQLPTGTNVRFTEWKFETNNADLFVVQGMIYEKILIILGDETVYWTFYDDTPYGRRIQGKACLDLTYCPCCINTQYEKIMETIKQHIRETVPTSSRMQ